MPSDQRNVTLYTSAQSRAIDRHAIEHGGVDAPTLMHRAAEAAFAVLQRRWPDARRILLIAGAGNNGGDAFLVGECALRAGFAVSAIALEAASGGDAALARAAYVAAGGAVDIAAPTTGLPAVDVIVDGLFGTGLARAVVGPAAALVEAVNASRIPLLALDVPSGLDADTGCMTGPTIRASATVCFIAWKRGLFTGDAGDFCGARELATLGVEASVAGFDADALLLDAAVAAPLSPRSGNVNKGTYGHVLTIGGDDGMGGAIRLASEAALRVGAGLVSVATRAAHVVALNAACPELMARGVEDTAALQASLARATVIAIGPGLGTADWGRALFDAALACGKPLVVDADALNLLAQRDRPLDQPAVLTPHPGEAARLLGCDTAAVQRDRFAAVRALASRYGAIVVLKGAGSLIGDPGGRVAVCPWGNAGMASGGMGDVLTGVIAALLAQHLSAWDAACLGVALHARAGDVAAGMAPRGLIATDLYAPLRQLANRFDT